MSHKLRNFFVIFIFFIFNNCFAQINKDIIESSNPINTNRQINTINKIVAFVNNGTVTSNELDNEIDLIRANYKDKKIKVPEGSDFRNNVLNQIILLRVQLDLAQRVGIKTTDIEITNAIFNIAKAQGLDIFQLKNKLINNGVNYDNFRQQIHDQITVEKLKQREVDAKTVVTDEEISRILGSEAYKNRIDYNLSYIVINLPEGATLSEIESKKHLANNAYQLLKSGQPFDDVSAKYSNAPNAMEGGSLGWKSNVVLPNIIVNALTNLHKNDLTPVIQLPIGFFIFKINDTRTIATPREVLQYHVRHILIKIGENSSDSEAKQKITMIEHTLEKYKGNIDKQNQEFTKLAKQYSEDTSSISGGDLGWVIKGDTVPEFETVMTKIPVGQISSPIKTAFGWHILEVIGVRQADKTNELIRSAIRQEVREAKSTLLYSEWLRSIKDAAYVKINDN